MTLRPKALRRVRTEKKETGNPPKFAFDGVMEYQFFL